MSWQIVAGAVFLILTLVIFVMIVHLVQKGAVARDDLDEAVKAEKLQRQAEAAAEAERKKTEDLR